ncbi:MAG: hypothetical protein ACRDJG_06600 [Actinomycetota bacterium]
MTGPGQETSRFERIFSPRSSRDFIGFAAVAVLINLASSTVPDLDPTLIRIFSTVLLVALFAFWWVRDQIVARRRSRLVAFTPTAQAPERARGLILLLGPYRADAGSEELGVAMERVLAPGAEAVGEEDFRKIGLFTSNLRPQVEALAYHSTGGVLRDVWLISGSEKSTIILERYIRLRHPTVVVHTEIEGDSLAVEAWNYTEVWRKAEMVFRESPYRSRVMLADVTGGTKMMSIALAMACIPPGRKLQYMNADRDHKGAPVPEGEIRPLLIDIDPILYREGREEA